MEGKSPLESKTIWVNLIMALVAVVAIWVPSIKDMVNEEIALVVAAVVNIVLRLVTKKPIEISK